jgi:hypothetical protein
MPSSSLTPLSVVGHEAWVEAGFNEEKIPPPKRKIEENKTRKRKKEKQVLHPPTDYIFNVTLCLESYLYLSLNLFLSHRIDRYTYAREDHGF